MPHIYDVFLRGLPLILMIGLGMLLRKRQVLSESTIPEIKKLIVQVTLPAMLLVTFAQTDFRAEYLLLFAVIFLFCCLMLALGILLGKKISPKNPYFPALFTGFEAGMMGYALFSTFFGKERTYAFAVVDIGQVLFVFFVLVFFLRKRSGAETSFRILLRDFALSPIIIAIISGMILGSTGLYGIISDSVMTGAIEETLMLLGAMTQPLICLMIGFELRLRFAHLKKPLVAIVIRVGFMLVAAFFVNLLIIDKILDLDPIFHLAVYTMFLLPPPFVIPIYLGKASESEKEEILDTLSLHIIVSLVAFMFILLITQ